MSRMRHTFHLTLASVAFAALLAGCGGESDTPQSGASVSQVGATVQVSPFVSVAQFSGQGLVDLDTIDFTIAPRAGAVAKAVHVTYSAESLRRRGDLDTAGTLLKLPIFGLYAGATNQVTVVARFKDASSRNFTLSIATPTYLDPSRIYDRMTTVTPRDPSVVLGFDYFYMKSALGAPVVVDTDGAVRWTAAGIHDASSSVFVDGAFLVGDEGSTTVTRLELDGSLTRFALQPSSITNFHHNIDFGKTGLLANVDATIGGTHYTESTIAEITPAGTVLQTWDFAALVGAYMAAQGDDPTLFVRPTVDWMHFNAATYDPSDNSLIVSSRENFVMKVDYASGNIIWILGDPTKYWHTFPSLRAKALTLPAGELYPIGQHSVSLNSDGLLMLFNDGYGSVNQPAGAPAGETRTYSAVSAYSIDLATMTAHEQWRFDHAKSIYSAVCSSAYEGGQKSVLIDYAVADNFASAHLVGIDANQKIAFEYKFPNLTGCNASWNAEPIAFENLTLN